jgi:hypothetical protein
VPRHRPRFEAACATVAVRAPRHRPQSEVACITAVVQTPPPSPRVSAAAQRSSPKPATTPHSLPPPRAPVDGCLTSLRRQPLPPSPTSLVVAPLLEAFVSPTVSHTCVGRRCDATLDLPPPAPLAALPRRHVCARAACGRAVTAGCHSRGPRGHGLRAYHVHRPLPGAVVGPAALYRWATAGQERYVRSASSLRLLLPLFTCLGAVGGGRSAPWIARVANALLDADACA